MLRNLLILLCLISATSAIAQTKTTEKQDDAKIDYKLAGTPMPALKVLLYKDTTTKKDTAITAETPRHAKKRKKHAKEMQQEAPSPYLTDKDLDNGANLFVMMFNPTCSHCQDETAMLEKSIFLFNKTQLVLLANPSMATYLPDFVNRLHVLEYPSMHVGIDSTDFINKVFLFQSLPQINIYDGNRKLIRTFSGEVAVDSLKKYIQ